MVPEASVIVSTISATLAIVSAMEARVSAMAAMSCSICNLIAASLSVVSVEQHVIRYGSVRVCCRGYSRYVCYRW